MSRPIESPAAGERADGPERAAAHPWQRLKQRIDAQEFPWLPPWPPAATDRAAAVRRYRRLALRLIRRQQGEPGALRCLAWPFLLGVKAWQSARDPELPGFGGRLGAGLRDLVVYNLRPAAMRPVRAQRPDHRMLTPLYVADRENQALLIALNATAPGARIGEKLEFADFCAARGLPHIPILTRGHGRSCTHAAAWPEADLFVKSANRWCGLGAEPLYRESAAAWRDRSGAAVRAETVGAWAGARHGDEPWLVQPMLRVDPAWSAWSPGPLGTVRIVTLIVAPGDAPEVIAASMRLPRTSMIVDNFSAGALSAEIDWPTGELRPALSRTGRQRWHDRHPDTGGRIAGAIVPRWSELLDLARAAHAAVPDLTAVGWDLSCHRGAPILIEANPVFNIAPTVVLGETRWLEAMQQRDAQLEELAR